MTKPKIDPNKVVPAELDGMPIEVATSMLTTPDVKMTARMRKNCMAARRKVYPSHAPMRYEEVTAEVAGIQIPGVTTRELRYQPDAKINAAVKLARRAKSLTFCQLNSHHARMEKRHALAQSTYLKLMASNASEQHKQAMGRILTHQAKLLEQAKDALATEIKFRRK